MADENPTRPGCAVTLTIDAAHLPFLRELFESAREGLLDDLAKQPDRVRDPMHSRREVAAYDQLLTALRAGVLVPKPRLRSMLADLARVIDAENEYARVLTEHEALQSLISQLDSRHEGDR